MGNELEHILQRKWLSSPFDSYNWLVLALATNWRLFRHPFALNGTVKNLLRDFILDNQKKDVTASFDSITEGIRFYEISKSCLLKGQFTLRK